MACCGRLRADWGTSFFGVKDANGKILDMEETFNAKPFYRTFFLKLIIFGWSLSVLVQDLYTYGDDVDFYLIYLTHWAFVVALLYLFFSFSLTLCGIPKQPEGTTTTTTTKTKKDADARPGFLVRLTWGLFATAATTQWVVVLLFWVFEYNDELNVTYTSYMKHGVIAVLVLLEGFLVNRVPVRAKHFVFCFALAFLYLIWTAIHAVLEIGNPNRQDEDPDTDDDAIYEVLSWNNRPFETGLVAALAIFVAVPGWFLVIWTLSMYSCVCSFDGSNRRYLKSAEKKQGNGYRLMKA